MASFSEDLDGMCADIADILGSEVITVTDGTNSKAGIKAVMGQRDTLDVSLGAPGSTPFDSRDFVVNAPDLGSVQPKDDGRTVVTDASGVRWQVTRATTEVDNRMWRLKTRRMRA